MSLIRNTAEFRDANRLAALLCEDGSIFAWAAFGGMADALALLAAAVATHTAPLSYENEDGAATISDSELNDWLHVMRDPENVHAARLFASQIPDDDDALVVCLRIWLTTSIAGACPHNVT